MEQIKQQIARENINFVRFEATDLHGVSRSKTVPVRFFHVMNSVPTYILLMINVRDKTRINGSLSCTCWYFCEIQDKLSI